ncbi:MAG TPA: class I SAM-dependent methyltransferase [Propionibacteriaceae bacterium]|nr:class I SAM-dependent methyltransferase [Propionibacteriaceae bacterium]
MTSAGAPISLLPALSSGATGLLDRVVGRRVKASIDRRVRHQVTARVGEHERLLEQALRSTSAQALIADEVARQLAQQRPAPDQRRINRDFTTDVFFGAQSRYDRMLTPSRYRSLAAEITELTGVTSLEWPMRQAYRSLLDHESRGLGRIAGSTYNIIGKLVVPVLLQPAAGQVLEIGTLFGLFSPALIRQFRRVGQYPELTVIDPLEGIQIQPELVGSNSDPTGTPVTSLTLQRNFEQFGLAEGEFRIVRGFSTDPVRQEEVADRRYDVVVIDGDHSEEGVYADLWWVENLVTAGGIVVMDDFGDPAWPGVERAGRRYLSDGGRLELLGTASTSAYLTLPA